MSNTFLRTMNLIVIITLVTAVPARPAARSRAQAGATPGSNASVTFIENVGQFPDGLRFLVRGGTPGAMWLAEDAIWLTLILPKDRDQRSEVEEHHDRRAIGQLPSQIYHLKLSFPGANPHPRLEPFNRQNAHINYYLGNDPARWRENVPVWGGVRYVDLYPGVDVEISGEGGQWNWQIVSHVPYSALDVRLRVEGADALGVEGDSLRVSTMLGDLILPLLAVERAAQSPNVHRLDVQTFDVASPFATRNPQSPISDLRPSIPNRQSDLLFSTFLGGGASDEAKAIAVDSSGGVVPNAAYVTGYASAGFPTTPGLDGSIAGDYDVFVSKLSADGSQLLYSTFLGGSYQNSAWGGGEIGYAIAVDENGSAYVTGSTRSADFPTTPNAFDPTYNGDNPCIGYDPPVACMDAFVAKLSISGTLAYGTYLGGSHFTIPGSGPSGGDDVGRGIAVHNGIIYVTGWTQSEDFPTTQGAYKRYYADVDIGLNSDAFVVKLNPAGQGAADLLYSTYVGRGCVERGYGIAVDNAGLVYVIGYAEGDIFPVNSDFPTSPGAFDRNLPERDWDALIFKLNPVGQGEADLMYATFLGADSSLETGHSITVDGTGAIYVTGQTSSSDFPTTPGAYDRSCGTDGLCNPSALGPKDDAFISKLIPAGHGTADLLYSTFLGGSHEDSDVVDHNAIALGADGDVYVTGLTWASDFPTTPGAFDASYNGGYYDAFVSRLRLAGAGAADLVYSTLLGGSKNEASLGIAPGQNGAVYVAGYTNSTDFPTTDGAYDQTLGDNSLDAFVTRLDATPMYSVSGQLMGAHGQPIAYSEISAGGGYTATADGGGWYTFTLPAGSYVLTPTLSGYLWSPPNRSVSLPPSAAGQDFTGVHIQKQVSPATQEGTVGLGSRLTYTLNLVYPMISRMGLYDAIPTYTSYISGSLVSSEASVVYDPAANIITGPLYLAGGEPATVTFAVQVDVAGTATFGPIIQNQAWACPLPGYSDVCEWSNTTKNYTYLWRVYLPIVMR